MSNLPQEPFNQLLTTYGKQICEDPQRCEALLRDAFPGYPREVSLLVNALKQGIPQELLASQGKVPMEVSRSRLTRKLTEDLFMQEQAAQWVIEAWSIALGLRPADPTPPVNLGNPPGNPANPPTMVQSPSLGQDLPAQNPTVIRSEASPPSAQPSYGSGNSGSGGYSNGPTPNMGVAMAAPSRGTPSVWAWYIVYCITMALVYACFILLGMAMLAIPSSESFSEGDRAMIATVYIMLGVIFGGIYGVAPFLPKRPWAWIYHIVLICLSFTSCCCIPFGIPLLVFWLKPETRVFFNMPVDGLPQNPN